MTQRLALLVNPASGKGKLAAQADRVFARLQAGGYDVTAMQGRDAAESADLASKVVADGYEALVVMGGDGLMHLALQAVANSATTLGVVGIGSGNDLARSLGLPYRDPIASADVIAGGATRTVDLARLDDAYYATVLAAGFDSLVNERANAMRWPRGQLRYTLATLAELRVFTPLPYTLELDGELLDCEAMLVAVGNGSSYGGGIRICEGAILEDGRLDVVVIKPVSKPELVKVYPRLFRGTHTTHPAYERHRVTKVRVDSPGIVAYADGERLGPLPVTVTAAPGALQVFTPSP
ncbi:MAG: diacylglycerol kinase [Nocardioidaceae bacterium]